MSAADIEERIADLLERRGYRVTPPVQRAIDTFLAVVEDTFDRRGRELDDEEEESGEEGDLAPTRMIDCPHCGERLPIALDLSGGGQDGIQDCEVCCRPIRVVYEVEDGRVTSFSAVPG